jgi:hypothetical protein
MIMIIFWGLPVFMDNFNDKSAAPSLSRGRAYRHSFYIKSVDFNGLYIYYCQEIS